MNRIARGILIIFAILAVATILIGWKKQDQKKARQILLNTYKVQVDKFGEDILLIANDPKVTSLEKIASLMRRAKTLEDGTPLDPTILDVTGSANLVSMAGAWQFQNLKSIIAIDCPKLKTMDGVTGLQQLNELNIAHNATLADVSAIRGLKSLVTINLTDSPALKELNIEGLPKLKNLYLTSCSGLQSLDVQPFPELRQLYLDSCRKLNHLVGLGSLSNLTDLDMSNCHSLEQINGLEQLKSLVVFDIRNIELADFSVLGGLPELEMLRLGGQANITNLKPFEKLQNLQEIHIEACPNFNSLEGMPKSLSRYAGFVNCPNLTSVKGVSNASENLTQLDLTGCTNLQDIAEIKTLAELIFVSFASCRKIKNIDQLVDNKNLKIIRLGGSGVTSASIGSVIKTGPKKGGMMLKSPLNKSFSPEVTVFDFSISE